VACMLGIASHRCTQAVCAGCKENGYMGQAVAESHTHNLLWGTTCTPSTWLCSWLSLCEGLCGHVDSRGRLVGDPVPCPHR
jgi:hypothetical protein